MLTLLKTQAEKKKAMELLVERPLIEENKGRYFRSPKERRDYNHRFQDEYTAMNAILDIENIENFLDLDNYDDDLYWQAFEPDWGQISKYLREAQRSENLSS